MKKVISKILFIVTSMVLLGDVYVLVYGVIDIKKTLSVLASTPGTSGIDYFGIGWGLGIGLFLVSIFGLILSVIVAKMSDNRKIKNISYILTAVFALLLLVGIAAFYM